MDNLISFVIYIFFFLFPLFYLPATSESYEYNKMVLVIVVSVLLLSATALKIVFQKSLTVYKSAFFLPIALLSFLSLASALFQSPNLIVTLTTPLATSTLMAGAIIYLSLHQEVTDAEKTHLFNVIVMSALIISVYSLLAAFGIFPNNSFTPAGTLLATTTFLAIISVYLLTKIVMNFAGRSMLFEPFASLRVNTLLFREACPEEQSDEWVRKKAMADQSKILGLEIVAFLIISGTTLFLVFRLLTTQPPTILPLIFGWQIFLETAKNVKTLALGVGPANFITAFTIVKPLAVNATKYWNMIFTSSSSFFLNLASEAGILAGLIYLVILLKSPKLPRSLMEKPFIGSLLFALFLQLILPSSMTVFILFIILLAFAQKKEEVKTIPLPNSRLFGLILLVPIVFAGGVTLFYTGKFYLAELYFKKSLDNLLNNNYVEAYNLQKQAISLNPHLDRYFVVFSRTNFALANSLAAKSQPTSEDREMIPNLVKQAIDNARTGVLLYRTNALNWDNLGRIYSGITGYAAGAQDWAVYSFRQKLLLDPLNPNNYLALANLYMNSKNFSEAENMAERAVKLKSDFAQAYYILYQVKFGEKKYKDAYDALNKTYNLLPSSSPDSEKVSKELSALLKLIPKEESTAAGVLENSKLQTLDENQLSSPSSAIQNLPESLPTISLPQTPNQ